MRRTYTIVKVGLLVMFEAVGVYLIWPWPVVKGVLVDGVEMCRQGSSQAEITGNDLTRELRGQWDMFCKSCMDKAFVDRKKVLHFMGTIDDTEGR